MIPSRLMWVAVQHKAKYFKHPIMNRISLSLFGFSLFIIIPQTLYAQNFQRINIQMFEQLDTVKNIHRKKLIDKHFANGKTKEVGVYVEKSVGRKKIYGYVGFHLKFYKNGNVKDSVFFDLRNALSGLGKGYFEDGKLRYICIGKDVSIEEGLHYSKHRTGLCDSYTMYYYKNGTLGSEFGINFRKSSNLIMDHAICDISYNEDGTIRSKVIY